MGTAAVEVRDLVKVYPAPQGGSLRAVDGISFEVGRGEIFGFLGPNGAGKTTTLEIIEGIKPATSGAVRVLGLDVSAEPDAAKRRIGVQLQKEAFFKKLGLAELLDLLASFYGMKVDAGALLGKVGLADKAKAQVEHLSGGQARRFSVAASLVNDPEVVFLDEPTSGLDPQARRHLWDLVAEVRESDKTVVLTTHHMEEAEFLCDRVAIMDHGRLIALDTPLALVRSMESAYHVRFASSDSVDLNDLERLPGVASVTHQALNGRNHYDLQVKEPGAILKDLDRALSSTGATDLRIEPKTLEDFFIAMTGRDLRD